MHLLPEIKMDTFSTLKQQPVLLLIWFVLLLWVILSVVFGVLNFMQVVSDFGKSTFSTVVYVVSLGLQIVIGLVNCIGVFRVRSWAQWYLGVYTILAFLTSLFTFGVSVVVLALYVYFYRQAVKLELGEISQRRFM